MKAIFRLSVLLTILTAPFAAQTLDLKSYRIVDLTHAFNAKTLYWPTSTTKFALDRLAYGPAAGGYFYSANSLSTPEHGGTHLDAPLHFAEKGRGPDAIPLEQLIAPAVVIDVTAQAAASRDYRLTREDVLAFEKKHGPIGAGTVVLLRTGWSRFWPDAKAYLGDDTPGDASKLVSRATAKKLRDCWSRSVRSARSASTRRRPTTESRPTSGFTGLPRRETFPVSRTSRIWISCRPAARCVIALPMKIEGGSGGPFARRRAGSTVERNKRNELSKLWRRDGAVRHARLLLLPLLRIVLLPRIGQRPGRQGAG